MGPVDVFQAVAPGEAPVAFGGARVRWAVLPPDVRARAERLLGSPVVGEVSATSGFSPGLASVVTTADGRRVFLKAAHDTDHPRAAELHRREAEVVAVLPPELPVPRVQWVDDDGTWVVAAYDALDGAPPATPWDPDVLAEALRTLDAVGDLPALRGGPTSGTVEVAGMFRGWERLRDDPDPELARVVPWAPARFEALAELASGGAAATVGDRLVHSDARADNIVVADGRTWLVDWAHAARAVPWFDAVVFLPSVGMQGVAGRTAPLAGPSSDAHRRAVGALLAELFAASRHGATARPDDVRAVLAGVAGYFLDAGRLDPVPGIANLRPFQRAQGVAAAAWLEALGV